MVPYLTKDWAQLAGKVMRHKEIYVHDRVTYALRRANPL